jgi:methylmalonyl-CoA mutase cobalamin-binding subunit
MRKAQIIEAFKKLNAQLSSQGVKGEVGVVGGAAMVLAFNARSATKDVDAIFAPSGKIRDAARIVASDLGLPEDWINDAVKAFLPGEPR